MKYKQVLFVFVGFLQHLHRVKSSLNRSMNTRLFNIYCLLKGKDKNKAFFPLKRKGKKGDSPVIILNPFMMH